ncbi:DUF2125 domain-containing protein [Caulobacter sp. NIBR2454]|uniref:DUF2125 domain-containing protein n=1 Tax=Caulobacter sp. NIBR2454 TaxID=3015996 RepID=UPI0022B5E936|nr:DUF2125 domain-containing protein [Caulobacter sp. NIBR2454]
MTLPDPIPPRKPRRFWLIAPYVVLLVAVAIWSVVWAWLRGETERRVDAETARLRAVGYDVAWQNRKISGYPFRLNVEFDNLRITEPSGWGLSAPVLKGEAEVFNLRHWVGTAPQGAMLTRPLGGPVTITGEALRASIAGPEGAPPRISIEGVGLSFAPGTGAEEYPLRSASRLEMHLRPGPDDQAAFMLKVEGARVQFEDQVLDRVARDEPALLLVDVVFSKFSAMRGHGWRDTVQRWTAAGGQVSVRRAEISTKDGGLNSQSGQLSVSPDGRLTGRIDAALGAQGATGGLIGSTFKFENGETRLSGQTMGGAPRIY